MRISLFILPLRFARIPQPINTRTIRLNKPGSCINCPQPLKSKKKKGDSWEVCLPGMAHRQVVCTKQDVIFFPTYCITTHICQCQVNVHVVMAITPDDMLNISKNTHVHVLCLCYDLTSSKWSNTWPFFSIMRSSVTSVFFLFFFTSLSVMSLSGNKLRVAAKMRYGGWKKRDSHAQCADTVHQDLTFNVRAALLKAPFK